MLLVKYKCGCFFTLKELGRDFDVKCQSCRANIRINKETSIMEIERFIEPDGVSVDVIPDNAKISVQFDV